MTYAGHTGRQFTSLEIYTGWDMQASLPTNFPPVDEQMDLLQKGAAEIIRVSDLRERLEDSRKTGRPLRVKGRL